MVIQGTGRKIKTKISNYDKNFKNFSTCYF